MTAPFSRRHMLALAAALPASAFLPRPARADDPGQPPPLEAYARSPYISQIAISPDAGKVAIITQQGDDNILISVDRAGQSPHTAHMGSTKVRDLFWADNDRIVVESSVVGELPQFGGFRDEIAQAMVIDPVSGKGKILWNKELDIASPIVFGGLGRIKTANGYRVTAANVIGFENICLATFTSDVDDQKTGQLTSQYKMGALPCVPYDNLDLVIAPDGRIVASVARDLDSERAVTKPWTVMWNTAKGSGPPLMKAIYRTEYSIESPELHGIGADGQSVIISLPRDDDDGWDFFTLTPDGKVSAPLDADSAGRARAPLFHPVTRRFAGFAYFDDAITYAYTDPVLATVAKSLPEAMGEEYRCTIADFAEDPRQLIVYVEGEDDAGSYYFLDLAGGANNLLGSNYPQIPAEWLAKRSPIRYAAADGLEIPAYLTLPPGREPKKLPLVVLPHGGPEARDTLDFDWQAQALASRGYAVLQPNFRGSGGLGPDFLKAGYGQWGRKMQTDLSDGVRWLVAQGTVDPKRVAIVGASYGGYAALAGATLDAGVYNCAVSIAGIADLKLKMQALRDRSESKYSDALLYMNRYFGDPARIVDISPIEHIDKVTIPVLLIHGKDDTVVEYEQSAHMNKALQSAGKDVQFISYDGQDHWETIPSARADMIARVIDFLAKHNPA